MNYIKGSRGIMFDHHLTDDQKPDTLKTVKNRSVAKCSSSSTNVVKTAKGITTDCSCARLLLWQVGFHFFTFCDQWRQKSIVVSFSVSAEKLLTFRMAFPWDWDEEGRSSAAAFEVLRKAIFHTQNFCFETLHNNNTIV